MLLTFYAAQKIKTINHVKYVHILEINDMTDTDCINIPQNIVSGIQ